MGKFIDMTGWTMSEHGVPDSRLTVINRGKDHIKPNGQYEIYWNCKCQCGNDYYGRGADIRNGKVLSCGCLQKERISNSNCIDMTGWIMKDHGVPRSRLTVTSKADNNEGEFDNVMWNCQCDCGNSCVAAGIYIRFGSILSCGCLADEARIQNGLKQKEYNEYITLDDVIVGFTNKGEQFQFSPCDYDLLKKYCWHIDAKGYVVSKEQDTGVKVKMHKLIIGEVGDNVIDHKNRDKTDNTRSNLRIVTKQENNYNHSIAKNNKSGIIGVIWHKRDCVWESYINVNNLRIYLGRFTNIEDATRERLKAELKYFGLELAPQRHLFKKYNIITEEKPA